MPGAKGQPQVASGDAPSLATQLNAVSDFAATVGTRRVGTVVERDAYTSAGYATDGDLWHVPSTGENFLRASGAWVRQQLVLTGQVTVPSSVAAGTVTSAIAVTFPVGAFLTAPKVFTESDTIRLNTASGSVTASGCDLYAANWSGAIAATGAIIKWMAVG